MDDSKNKLFYGDCLEIMCALKKESIDLIYLDPPFNANQNFNMLFGNRKTPDFAQAQAFTDIWSWQARDEAVYDKLIASNSKVADVMEGFFKILNKSGMMSYLMFMAERLLLMKDLLKPKGSIYFHCDATASHYLKILMDSIFNGNNFRNEIVWCYTGPSGSKKNFPKKHDIRLRYSKSNDWVFNADDIRIPYKDLHSDSGKDSKIWGETGVLQDKQKREEYLNRGKIPEDFWVDIPSGGHISPKERLNYPTQKPLSLLKRIIQASSNKGDIVLDPFCGCGTATDAAQELSRNWIGIDISYLAIDLIRKRLADRYGEELIDEIQISGIPRDVKAATALFNKNPFDFERWAVSLVKAFPNDKQVGDKGSDGILRFPLDGSGKFQTGIVSVKGGKTLNPNMVQSLTGALNTHNAMMGVLITLAKPTKGMLQEAQQQGEWHDNFTKNSYPKIQIITIEKLLKKEQPNMPTPINPYNPYIAGHSSQISINFA